MTTRAGRWSPGPWSTGVDRSAIRSWMIPVGELLPRSARRRSRRAVCHTRRERRTVGTGSATCGAAGYPQWLRRGSSGYLADRPGALNLERAFRQGMRPAGVLPPVPRFAVHERCGRPSRHGSSEAGRWLGERRSRGPGCAAAAVSVVARQNCGAAERLALHFGDSHQHHCARAPGSTRDRPSPPMNSRRRMTPLHEPGRPEPHTPASRTRCGTLSR